MKGRSKTCYVLAAAGKEESIQLLRQILRGVSGAGQLRIQQAATLEQIRRGVSGAGAQSPADLLIAVMPLGDGTGVEGIIDVAQRHPQLMSILLVRQEAYEQVTYQCRNQQIFVIAMPFKRQVLAEAASFMLRIRTVIDDKDKELARMRKNLPYADQTDDGRRGALLFGKGSNGQKPVQKGSGGGDPALKAITTKPSNVCFHQI